MSADHASRRKRSTFGRLGLVTALLALTLSGGSMANATNASTDEARPTIVLVHGAFADASGWNEVTKRLQAEGYPVVAPANPERGLLIDSAYLSSILSTIDGPVVLVGHSYGGAVITNAAIGHPNVKALVYIAAFAPDLGETVGGLVLKNPGSGLTPENLVLRPYPVGVDGYISPRVFHEVFAADLPAETAAIMAAGQRPAETTILVTPSGLPAWRTIPSWYMVAADDKTIPPATERFMAQRAGATTVEIRSSHVAMISHPDAVKKLIVDAAKTAH
ncbi:MAG TPA: alpha/beta hydrolase [Sporichthyaceae bacterium]|jgi:pimeloyl-ACP methyl ester carboxylesterase|nr:alpha/beta hydrolase [Sporichthyaceae bacterium]